MTFLSAQGHGKTRRSYRPTVEALDALRLLSGATQTLPDLAVALGHLSGGGGAVADPVARVDSDAAWDEVLTQTRLADILGRSSAVETLDARDVEAGLSQLNRYLSRAWFRAGIPPQMHDDCTQAVYVSLLQNLGRDGFDGLLSDVGKSGVREVLSRETLEGPDFFRAIDTVKKRAQRERTYQPIDAIDVVEGPPGGDTKAAWRGALQEVIDQSLTPREASLVYDTLMGKTPAEIASDWGVAPKTVSNEKTRVLQKLREALVTDFAD